MSKYVIDASIAVKWLFDEIYREEAKRFLHPNLNLIAPEILLLECANAIRKKALFNHITDIQADEGFHLLFTIKNQYSID